MSTPLHPSLADLDARYGELVAQIQSQQISVADAIEILSQTVAIDGAGREWRINETGEFVANWPGEPAQPADVSEYADTSAAAPQAPWGIQPPSPSPVVGGGAFGPNGGGGPSAGFGGGEFGTDSGELPRMMDLGSKGKGPKEPKEPKVRPLASGEPRPIVDKVLGDNLGAKVRANKRPLIVGVVALVLVAVFATRGGSDTPADSGIPTDTAVTDTTIAEMPADTSTPTTEAASADPTVPNATEVEAVLVDLQSGDRARVRALVANPGDEATVAVRTAQYAGYPHSGLAFRAGPAAEDESGVITDVELIDSTTGTVYRTAKVRWVFTDGQWQIVDHIDMATPPASAP